MKLTNAVLAGLCLCVAGFTASWAAPASPAQPVTIRVLSSVALRQIFIELFEQFGKQSGYKIEMETGGTAVIDQRVEAGEPFDVVVLAANNIDKLIGSGKIKQGSRVDLAKSGISIAVRKGAKTFDISSGEAVKQAVVGAKTIGYSAGPSGVYLLELFKRWGIADQIKDRLIQVPPGAQVGAIVAKGEAEIGFHQLSELIHIEGIAIPGPLPADVQHITVWSAGVTVKTEQQEAVTALLKFLASPAAADAKRKNGMEPI